jgi:hypothetical protein
LLTSKWVALYGGLVVLLYVCILVTGVLLTPGGPPRVDFIAFHAAGRLAIDGQAGAAYDWDQLRKAQADILGVPPDSLTGFLGWLNPPHYFFAVLPFAPLSYAWAWAAWIVTCCIVYALAVRAVMPGSAALVVALCAPSVLVTLGVGQNGLLVAALMAWTLALLDTRPLAAGLALGLLTIKPQFGLLLPLLLALTGRWTVFGVAALTAMSLMVASLVAFGPDVWRGFLLSLSGAADRYLVSGADALPRIQSMRSFVLKVSGNEALAWVAHAAFATVVTVIVARLWIRRPASPQGVRAAAAIAGTFLVTPYAWIYDTPALAIAALFLARAAEATVWLPGERALLTVGVVGPAIVLVVPSHSLVAPAAWLLILACAWRRDRAVPLSPAPSGLPSAGT